MKIAFIGGGNMARSLIGGLLAGQKDAPEIAVADPAEAQRKALSFKFGVATTHDNATAVDNADLVVLAVKPQIMHGVANELGPLLQNQNSLVISIAAGIREPDLRTWLAYGAAIVRCMPNTPALVGSGATALYANSLVSSEQRNRAESLLRAVGTIIWVTDEAFLDAVTALSGSGPAYIFAVMEAMEIAGTQLGLSAGQARLLTIETVFGAAKMALESEDSPTQLRMNVSSKGGTTEAALEVLKANGLQDMFVKALSAAHRRSQELGEQLGAN